MLKDYLLILLIQSRVYPCIDEGARTSKLCAFDPGWCWEYLIRCERSGHESRRFVRVCDWQLWGNKLVALQQQPLLSHSLFNSQWWFCILHTTIHTFESFSGQKEKRNLCAPRAFPSTCHIAPNGLKVCVHPSVVCTLNARAFLPTTVLWLPPYRCRLLNWIIYQPRSTKWSLSLSLSSWNKTK